MTTEKFNQVIKAIIQAGGSPHLVGGAVRDRFMNMESKDLDVEVFRLTVEQLIEVLSSVGKPNIDDRKFGVIRLNCGLDEAVEFSLPRKDNATGERAFGGVFPDLSVEEASRRRDFTFNAMSQDLVTGKIVDPFGGERDLKAGIIQVCDLLTFCEDAIRGPRGFRFAGQIDGEASQETKTAIWAMNRAIAALPTEAWWSEWEKWADRSIRPSKGLKFLVDTGMINIFPEIKALIGCPQDPVWHPEGDVFTHTGFALDAIAGRGVVPVLAALCHDFGKPSCTSPHPDTGRWVSPGHAEAGKEPTRSFLARIGAPKMIIKQVIELVCEHMTHLGSGNIGKRQARRLLVRLKHASVDDLLRVIEADNNARPPLNPGMPERANTLQGICKEVEDEVTPFVLGRHLIASGMSPGPRFGPILKAAFEAQIEGAFSNDVEGICWLRKTNLI